MRYPIAAIVLGLTSFACGKHAAPESGSAGSAPSGSAGSGSAAPAAPPAPSVVADPVPQSEAHALALATCPRLDHPTYFAIAKAGKTSHMFGTRHFGIGIDRIPPQIVADIKAAKVAYFETPPGDDGSVKDPDVDLPAMLGAPAWQHLRELIGSDKAGELAHMHPMFAAVLLPSLYEDLTDGLDDELAKVAADAKVATKGLESGLFQDKVLHEIFTADVARAIIMATKTRDEIKTATVKELGDYCAGNPGNGGFDDLTRHYFAVAGYDDKKIGAIESELVFDRTSKWVPELEPALAAGDAFIAVGADHLVGDKGLAALLTKAGYKVTPVTVPPSTK